MMHAPSWPAAAVLALLCLTFEARATTHHVYVGAPYPQNTIQWGLDSAADGDTVLVGPGTFTGEGNRDLRFNGKDIVLLSEAGALLTIIDLEDEDCGIRCGAGVDSTAVIDGFTLRNGWGSGIACTSGASPQIRNCVIEDCFGGYGGGGIAVDHSSPVVADVLLQRNRAQNYGGGAYVTWSDTRFERVTFLSNRALLGAGMSPRWSTTTLVDCSFLGNTASRHGGGLWLGGGTIHLSGVVCSGNDGGEQGGGLYATSTVVIADNCKFEQNESSVYGAGAFLRGVADPSLFIASVFEENHAGTRGGGLYLEDVPASIVSTTFDRNDAGNAGGGLYCWGASATVDSSTFYCNSASNAGGGFGIAYFADADLSKSTFFGNSAARGAGLDAVTSEVSLSQLIVAFNATGNGIEVGGSPVTTFHCCVYGNAGGDSLGGTHFENLFTDPIFCGAPSGDLTLREDSPCLPANNEWGVLIGSRDRGCDVTAVEDVTWGRLKAMYR